MTVITVVEMFFLFGCENKVAVDAHFRANEKKSIDKTFARIRSVNLRFSDVWVVLFCPILSWN